MTAQHLSCERPHIETRERILDAAQNVFRENGFHFATMDAIARSAGVSKKTIYKLFSSKDDLFFSLIDQLKAELGRVEIDPRQSPAEALEAFLNSIGGFLMRDRSINLLRMIMTAETTTPDLALRVQNQCPGGVVIALEAYLDGLAKNGTLDIDDPADASRMLVGLAVGSLHQEMLLGLRTSVPEDLMRARIRRAVHIFLHGTLQPRARASLLHRNRRRRRDYWKTCRVSKFCERYCGFEAALCRLRMASMPACSLLRCSMMPILLINEKAQGRSGRWFLVATGDEPWRSQV